MLSLESTHHAAELQESLRNCRVAKKWIWKFAGHPRPSVFGKLAFFSLQDETGTIQLYLDKKRIQSGMADGDPDAFHHLKQLTDRGHLGVKGTIKRWRRASYLSMRRYAILTKSLLPLPDKWHGLTDIAKRYRQRYVDLMLTRSAETFRRRARITSGFAGTQNSWALLKLRRPFSNRKPVEPMPVPSLRTTIPWRWVVRQLLQNSI